MVALKQELQQKTNGMLNTLRMGIKAQIKRLEQNCIERLKILRFKPINAFAILCIKCDAYFRKKIYDTLCHSSSLLLLLRWCNIATQTRLILGLRVAACSAALIKDTGRPTVLWTPTAKETIKLVY